MDESLKKILLAVLVSIILMGIIFVIALKTRKCKPHCNGIYCNGPNAKDGCGGKCGCKEGGVCQRNGICCYPNCQGLNCGPDGCGGSCENTCNALPNGRCMSSSQCSGEICPPGQCLSATGSCVSKPGYCMSTKGICIPANICCYAQDCNGVYCGPNGCGGTCSCQSGSTCSSSTGPGVCVNSGTPGWTYSVFDSDSVQRTNTSDPISCASWIPSNLILNLQNFPCQDDSDCPYLQQCITGPNGKFCDRNNIFQYWYYDPTDPSGYNCTKVLAGSTVCGVKKPGASGFDVIGNVGPDKTICGQSCTIEPSCPPSGPGSCCPETWTPQGSTANCVDATGKTQCCLNNPSLSGYTACIAAGYKDCANLTNVWWKGNKAEITNGCDSDVTGAPLPVNNQTMSSFESPCIGLSPFDKCTGPGYSGFCRTCTDGNLRCFPEKMCVNKYSSAGPNGTCSSASVC